MTKSGLLEVLFASTLIIGPYEFIDIHNTWISKCNCTLFMSSMKSSEDNFNIPQLQLRDEAALTLSCIDKCRDGGFEEVFMTKVDIPAKFDYSIR